VLVKSQLIGALHLPLKLQKFSIRLNFWILWPWPWPSYLDIWTWITCTYSKDVPANRKWTFQVKPLKI